MTSLQYSDDDLVYVDPESRTVIGRVEWNADGTSKPRPYDEKKEGEKKAWRKFYPWGTYRGMKGAFHIDGKRIEEESAESLDDVLPKALNDVL